MYRKTNTSKNRGVMIAFAKNAIATINKGISKNAYYNLLANAIEIGFNQIEFRGIQDSHDCEKVYREAFKSYWILIAMSHSNKFAIEVDNELTFAKLFTVKTKNDLVFYVWYPSDDEVKSLAAKTQSTDLPLDELEIESRAMKTAPGCS